MYIKQAHLVLDLMATSKNVITSPGASVSSASHSAVSGFRKHAKQTYSTHGRPISLNLSTCGKYLSQD